MIGITERPSAEFHERTTSWVPKPLSNQGDIPLDAASGCINNQVLTVPTLVLAGEHFAPGRKPQSGNVGSSSLHSSTMFVKVRTADFDFDGASLRPMRNFEPGVARPRERIDGICDHGAAEPEIVFGNGIGDAVSQIIERL